MDLKEFIDQSGFGWITCKYYISDDGQKKPRYGVDGEIKTMEDVIAKQQERENENKFNSAKYGKREMIPFYYMYTYFKGIACIDVDEKSYNSYDEFINNNDLSELKDCYHICGNNKGWHIFIKINDD